MTRRPLWAAAVALGAVAPSCGAVAEPAGSPAPINACQTDPDCAAYTQTGVTPQCLSGRCLVPQSPGTAIAVITLAQSAPNGAGKTFALPFTALLTSPVMAASGATMGCRAGSCAQLPSLVSNRSQNQQDVLVGNLKCTAYAAQKANYYLGGTEVTVPVQATFTPLWRGASGAPVDAASLGLPLLPLVADTITDPGTEVTLGPGGGPGLEFYLAEGLPPGSYERVLAPLPPFDRAYPPDVERIDLGASQQPSENLIWNGFDSTTGTETGGQSDSPTFRFNRADGGALEGWTAYLRDAITLRPLSAVAQLSGVDDDKVKLLTSHHVADALAGSQLVLAPPGDAVLPTWIFTPVNGSLAAGSYPELPPAIRATLAVVDAQGAPVAADLVFEANDICRFPLGGATPKHDLLSANHDFAFLARAAAGSGGVEVELPLGGYRVTAIPRGSQNALTVVKQLALADSDCNPVAGAQVPEVRVIAQSVVTGTALVADQRPLAGATVEVVPVACADGEAELTCMPRAAQTTTTPGGTYAMLLDPGGYLLRVRPAEGSGLPWVVQPLSVTPTATTTAPVTHVPAPVAVGLPGLRLFDSLGNPVAEAIVRVFQTPSNAAPYEIGEAITDGAGHFDMYLDPSAQ